METWDQTFLAWQTLESIVDTGEVKQIGISNCYDPDLFSKLYESAKIKPALIQNRFYQQTNYDNELRQFCRKNNVAYQSFWTLTANDHILASEAVTELSSNKDKTPAQIFFRYLIQKGLCPLIGSTSPLHMDQDLDIFNFSLEESECSSIDVQINSLV